MLLVGGWAAREVKSGARAEAAEIPKGRAVTAGGFRVHMEEEAGLNLHHKAGTARSLMGLSA